MVKATKSHHVLAPSAAERWLVCSGEPALRAKVPNTTSVYAQEGTTAHWVAEQCLKTGKKARHYVNQRCPETMQIVPEEMAAPVQVYVDHCNTIRGQWNRIETKFKLPKISEDLGGTCDFCSVVGTVLHVPDFKYGKGYAVKVKNNPQLLIYALGAYEALLNSESEIASKLTSLVYGVAQPRLEDEDPIRLEKMLLSELLDWKRTVLFKGVTATEKKDTEYVAGSHCRFCPGKAICPAQRDEAQRLAQVDFGVVVPVAPPKAESLSPDQLARILTAKDDLNSWLNSVEAFAQSLLEQGNDVPGFKLVAKRANRVWTDEKVAEIELQKLIGENAFAPRELLSVAQVEKALKFVDKKVPEALATKPDTGHIIAPMDDARPPVVRSAIADFCDDDFLK